LERLFVLRVDDSATVVVNSAGAAATVNSEVDRLLIAADIGVRVAENHSPIDVRGTLHIYCPAKHDDQSVERVIACGSQVSGHNQDTGSAEGGTHVAIAFYDIDFRI